MQRLSLTFCLLALGASNAFAEAGAGITEATIPSVDDAYPVEPTARPAATDPTTDNNDAPEPPPHIDAQRSSDQDDDWSRDGAIIGASAGAGATSIKTVPMGCSGCSMEPVEAEFEFHLGLFVRPRLALAMSIGMNILTATKPAAGPMKESDTLAVQGVFGVTAQYWPVNRLWIRGGAGVAHYTIEEQDGVDVSGRDAPGSKTGAALVGAIGGELYSSDTGSGDLFLSVSEVAYGRADHGATVSLMFGFNKF